ncbi:MAG: hypothetical protein QOD60_1276 [Solirubrobacterales bacterium]|jgi:hypothetical protein|nr:hypothetical protein [Solirubrobacterales bacterium]
MKSRKLVPALATVAVAGLLALSPAVASADTYAPGANNQTFATGFGGWTQSSASTGLCVPAVTCPIVSNTWQSTGGAGGAEGFLRTTVTSVATLATTTNAIWQSPTYTYNGNGGAVPTTATFTMDRQADVTALLAIAGAQANYTVELLDATTGTALTVVPPTTQAGAAGWTSIPAVNINPSQLNVGHRYAIRVTSTYTNGTGVFVLPTGGSDYDNVKLSTTGAGQIPDSSVLAQLIQSQGLPGSAKLKGNKLQLKIKCPKQAAPNSCKYLLQGLAKGKKSKAATALKRVTVKAGKKKTVSIAVKQKFLAKYQKAKKVYVKANVSVGALKTTTVKKLKLKH